MVTSRGTLLSQYVLFGTCPEIVNKDTSVNQRGSKHNEPPKERGQKTFLCIRHLVPYVNLPPLLWLPALLAKNTGRGSQQNPVLFFPPHKRVSADSHCVTRWCLSNNSSLSKENLQVYLCVFRGRAPASSFPGRKKIKASTRCHSST